MPLKAKAPEAGISALNVPSFVFLFLRSTKTAITPIAMIAPSATPTPIPAFAPVNSPEDDELGTALALTVVAILTLAALLAPQTPYPP